MSTKWAKSLVSVLVCFVMILGMIPAIAQTTFANSDIEYVVDSWEVIGEEDQNSEKTAVDTSASAKKNVSSTNLSDDIDVEYYGRSALTKLSNSTALLYAYDQIAKGIEASESLIYVYNGTDTISKNELQMVIDAYRRDYAHHFWLGNSYKIGTIGGVISVIQPSYIMSGTQLETAKTAFKKRADSILSGLTNTMSEYDKELYLHDMLAANIAYVSSDNCHNAYGALIEGNAVCEGYAEALQYLLMRAGIQSFIVTGTSKQVGHAWNVVRIDQKYYHTDLTWDDQGEKLYHAYFNLSDDMILEDHTIDATAYALPVCSTDTMEYFSKKQEVITDYDTASIAKLLKENGMIVHVFNSGHTVDDFHSWFYENISSIARQAGITGGFSFQCSHLGKECILKMTKSCSHSYNDYHVCTICNALETDQLAGNCGFNVSLAGDIGLMYNFVLDDVVREDSTAKVVFTVSQGDDAHTVEVPVNRATRKNGQYVISCNVAAAEMADSISAKVVSAYGESESYTYCVKQYADYILENESLYKKEQSLVKKLLHYGAAAQIYFSHNTDSLATAGLGNENQVSIPETTETPMSVNGAVNGLSVVGATLVFRNKIAARFYFSGDVSDKTFMVAGESYTPVLKDGKYYVEIANILPQDLDEIISLTVTDGSGNTLTICYSPMNYIVRMNQKGDDITKTLLTALYNYHLAAKEYAGN